MLHAVTINDLERLGIEKMSTAHRSREGVAQQGVLDRCQRAHPTKVLRARDLFAILLAPSL
jgi:hypothetical protein